MVKEIERAGFPIVHLASMTPISLSIGANRIVQGISVPYPCSDPKLPQEEQYKQRCDVVMRCLKALSSDIKQPTVF